MPKCTKLVSCFHLLVYVCATQECICIILIFCQLVHYFILQEVNPHVATYYTNRALCCMRLRHWDLTVQDCQKAIQIEPNLIKAHFYLGQALTEIESYDDAISALIKGE